jgi:hypothetical protein
MKRARKSSALPGPTVGMLEEGDVVEYERDRSPERRRGEATIRGYTPYLWVGEGQWLVVASKVRLLRIWRAGVVVAEVQEVGAARGRRSEFVRARAGG